jgi:hypothetical protein
LKMSGTREAWANAKHQQPEKMRAARREAPLVDILPRQVFASLSKLWDMTEYRTKTFGRVFRQEAHYHKMAFCRS